MTSAADGENGRDGDIAVIGMAGRFPGAAIIAQFWQNLVQCKESVSVLTDEPGYLPAYGLLAGADEFDAEFFGISADDAVLLDPQQRVLLECAHEALEAAGHGGPDRPVTGVFVGGSSTDHAARVRAGLPTVAESKLRLGTDLDYLSSRIAYQLGLSGPALTVLTACSSSLVAVHTAVQSLLAGDCEVALAGGASVLVDVRPERHDPDDIHSADGHCRPFDAAAGGTVPASGVGLVVLRPLADAHADGDHVHAVIRGTAVNNDGRDKVGFAAPSAVGQAEVVEAAHLVAGVGAGEISYLEAHGTATALGDPLEVAALTQAFRTSTDKVGHCLLGSVMSNIGHTYAAAGVAALLKTVLSVEHAVVPASLHFTAPNPEIDFASSPFVVNARTRQWESEGPRIAGVHATGVGGTNAHAVVAQAPATPAPAPAPDDPHQLLVLSARTATALEAAAARLTWFLAENPDVRLADVAWTLQTGRTHHAERRFVVATSASSAATALRDGTAGVPHPLATTGTRWLSGEPVDFAALHNGPRRRVPLPTYPFERRRYVVPS